MNKIPPKPADAQCTECRVESPYEAEILAGGIHCLGCGRKRPGTKYVLASSPAGLKDESWEHDPDVCGCEDHADWCPYNPNATQVPDNEKIRPAPSPEELNRELREENEVKQQAINRASRIMDEKELEIQKLKKEIDGWIRYKQNIDEALNSGDGVYRP